MFLPVRNETGQSPLPQGTKFAAGDWRILSRYWHPVATSADIADKPFAARLLDRQLVLWRSEAGVHAARDLCMHRGGQLTLGAVRDGMIVCPLHGFRYDGEGACRKVPALGSNVPVPKKLRLESYPCQERYGLVWVCLDQDPVQPLPEWPQIEAGEGTVVVVPPGIWYASAARHVENFNDLCHIPFVHKGTFGGEEDRTIEAYGVEITDATLGFETEYAEQTRYTERRSDGSLLPLNRRRYTYRLTLPFASSLKITDIAKGSVFHIFDVASPVSVNVSNIFQILVDATGKLSAGEMIDFQQRINAEDAPLVEAQSPLELPLDLRDEIHIPADRMSIEYRRSLARLGLGADAILGSRYDSAGR